ncbi:hypothetical protein Hanom_Chr09g00852621 [Helianthus anomalus]
MLLCDIWPSLSFALSMIFLAVQNDLQGVSVTCNLECFILDNLRKVPKLIMYLLQ